MDCHSDFVHLRSCLVCTPIFLTFFLGSKPLGAGAQVLALDPAKMPRIGAVDERFASYNIEMAEVTGGNFWKPYRGQNATPTLGPQCLLQPPPA